MCDLALLALKSKSNDSLGCSRCCHHSLASPGKAWAAGPGIAGSAPSSLTASTSDARAAWAVGEAGALGHSC